MPLHVAGWCLQAAMAGSSVEQLETGPLAHQSPAAFFLTWLQGF
ncbi:hypothetical protein [Polaromonas sp. CG9_12]|nr:hypothetical protein [Polaromonas sp. CG9_12]